MTVRAPARSCPSLRRGLDRIRQRPIDDDARPCETDALDRLAEQLGADIDDGRKASGLAR